jgi:hypothetical protein
VLKNRHFGELMYDFSYGRIDLAANQEMAVHNLFGADLFEAVRLFAPDSEVQRYWEIIHMLSKQFIFLKSLIFDKLAIH